MSLSFRFSLLLFLSLFLLRPAYAQFEDAVTFTLRYEPAKDLAVGDVLTIYIDAEIEEGYHMYSARQVESMMMVAASFDLDKESSGVTLLGALNDKGKRETKYDDIFRGDISLYHGKVTYVQKVKITSPVVKLAGYLRYQVCDDSQCIPGSYDVVLNLSAAEKKKEAPALIDTAAKAAVVAPVVTIEDTTKADTSRSEAVVNEPVASKSAAEVSATPASRSLWSLAIEGMLLGLIAVFTPCMFPMIPLTVSFFTKQSGSRGQAIRKAMFYGASIITIFTGVALILAAIFGPSVLQEVSNKAWFNVFFFILLTVFALSFLGWFEITLPSSWSTAVSKASDRGGMLGIFLMALALAIVSFSCTGPLVAWAMAEAFRGGFWGAVVTMLAFSSALAAPFVLMAIFPHWLKSMPRSGGWMNAVKVTLGFLELAFALIYLSRADLVEHWGILDREIFLGGWIVIFSLLGMYLLGKLQLPHDMKPEFIPVPRLMLAIGVFWFVTYLIPGLWGAPLRMLGGYIPSVNRDMGVLVQGGLSANTPSRPENDICDYPNKISEHLNEGTPAGFCAFYDLEQGLAYAKEHNKPVFLDFTGHTCANCRYLEQNMWIDPEIRQMITEEYVLISLYTDDRKALPEVLLNASGKKIRTVGDQWLNFQMDTYQTNAQPYYVLLDHDKSLLTEASGFSGRLDLGWYRDFFRKGLETYRKRKA
ncbi:MAG: DUF255 domain-containing protein [Bacteroidetes bacterium]|nr:MAG: DUF255 domain-containing protein [Bacteroidota bacterium]